MATWTWFHRLASPPHVYAFAQRWTKWFGGAAALAMLVALYGGLVMAPPDYQQKDAFRMVYIHAPAAWLSLMIYTTMAVAAAVGLIWRMKVAHAAAAACAPVGAWFTVVALGTGMLWGKPMWGAYWVWDPRLTSELILLFLYLGYMGLRAGIEDPVKADKASAVLAVVGVVNVPIIKYSVEWWNSLHQTPTVMQMGKPKMDGDMLWPLLLMFVAFALYFVAVLLTRLRAELLRRERNASWIREVLA
ncbi:MAG: heme transporter permease [Steroidobacteraceae bacterium]|jgi:heme exporter protein C|nr:heme transporter permease [Steroidobacteraceae bacterium]